MEKLEIRKILDTLKLDKDEYCIFSGGSLVMHGVRDKTGDIDLLITKDALLRLKKQFIKTYREEKSTRNNEIKYILNDYIECFIKDKDSIINQSVDIEGYSCQNLDKIIELKKELNREKDIIDIRLIEEYLKNK